MAILTIRNSSCIEPQGGWVEYGLLYNWYAATDVREISSSDDWAVMSNADQLALVKYIDPDGSYYINTAGKNLKESSDIYWSTNTGTNDYGFNGRGSGYRTKNVGFVNLRKYMYLHSSDNLSTASSYYISLKYDIDDFDRSPLADGDYYGMSVRLVKNTTTLTHGQTGTYVGNDGKVYQTICIGTQEWLAENLAETKYRNGDIIPEVTDGTTWSNLTTGALCAYENDWNNVGRTKPSYY